MVLADGFFVWVHDPDLEQITRQKQASAVEGTPAQLLTNDVPVEKNFKLSNDKNSDGLEWIKLIPKNKESQYETLKAGFKGKNLKALIIEDKFNQKTRIDFNNIKRNPKLAWDFFVFEPPKGTDVIER
jgi:outer membrane lipoprotein carrier protein